jgi:hypothetical protein
MCQVAPLFLLILHHHLQPPEAVNATSIGSRGFLLNSISKGLYLVEDCLACSEKAHDGRFPREGD